jgi:catechol 2,3-dioxygenase-like lactoylglutathione lyase family enzyme
MVMAPFESPLLSPYRQNRPIPQRATLGIVERNAQVLGLELIVDDVERAVAVFVDLLGFELQHRGRFELFAGEVALVTDGAITVTLLQPTTDGDEPVLPDRTPRLSQLIVGNAPGNPAQDLDRVVDMGLSVAPTTSGFYVTPESTKGALGLETAIVVVWGGSDHAT